MDSQRKRTVEVKSDDYTITLSGPDIKNYENEFVTSLYKKKIEQGLEVVLNEGLNLPGIITLQLKDSKEYSYVYLCNKETDEYKQLSEENLNAISVDVSGTYLFTEEKMNVRLSFSIVITIVVMTVIVIILGIIYVIRKKAYWFW